MEALIKTLIKILLVFFMPDRLSISCGMSDLHISRISRKMFKFLQNFSTYTRVYTVILVCQWNIKQFMIYQIIIILMITPGVGNFYTSRLKYWTKTNQGLNQWCQIGQYIADWATFECDSLQKKVLCYILFSQHFGRLLEKKFIFQNCL